MAEPRTRPGVRGCGTNDSGGLLWSNPTEAALVLRIVRAARLGEPRHWVLQSPGDHHQTYRVETAHGVYAVRLATARRPFPPRRTIRSAISAAVVAERLGIGPALICKGTLRHLPKVVRFTVWEWLSGRQFNHTSDMRAAAVALAALHRGTRGRTLPDLRTVNYPAYLAQALRRYRRLGSGEGSIPSLLRSLIADALHAVESCPSIPPGSAALVHHDLVAENILIAGGRARLIDWDWAIVTDPAVDLCVFLSPFVTSWRRVRFLRVGAARAFLDDYVRAYDRVAARSVVARVVAFWTPVNALLASWVHFDSPVGRPHFEREVFYRRALRHAAGIGAVFGSRAACFAPPRPV